MASADSAVKSNDKEGGGGGILSDEETGVIADVHGVDDDGEDLLAQQALDPALNMKMHLVNNVRLLLLCFLLFRCVWLLCCC